MASWPSNFKILVRKFTGSKISRKMTQDFISQIPELNKPYVHMRDKQQVNKIINELVEGGAKKLQIVSDFDKTITKQHENGKIHLSSFGMFSFCPSLPQSYIDEEKTRHAKYSPIEFDPTIPMEEKKKHMVEWWSKSENATRGLKVSEAEIEEVVKKLGPSLRNGSIEFFKDLCDADVPVLVFSAGLGNTVVACLKHGNVMLPNVHVISNFLKYLENGEIDGFKEAFIHVFNKNELALKGTKYYDLVQERENIIVMGDSVGDANMADGVPQTNAVLKIGFLYDQASSNLPEYLQKFDIVLVDDQTFHVAHTIVKHILKIAH